MKTITKLTFALLAILLIFTACSSNDDDNPAPAKVAKEITAEDLANYMIIEEYTPKPEYAIVHNTKPILLYTYFQHQAGNSYVTKSGNAKFHFDVFETKPSYNSETGITTIKTAIGDYELSRDDSEQIIMKKSNQDENANYSLATSFTSSYIQLVKRYSSAFIFYQWPYKEISGAGYYAFNANNKWRYKQGTPPIASEYTWDYTALTNQIWHGQDGGSAQYYNLFLILPSGNGWKGQHKDKALLIANTLDVDYFKAVGDIGIYTSDNF